MTFLFTLVTKNRIELNDDDRDINSSNEAIISLPLHNTNGTIELTIHSNRTPITSCEPRKQTIKKNIHTSNNLVQALTLKIHFTIKYTQNRTGLEQTQNASGLALNRASHTLKLHT